MAWTTLSYPFASLLTSSKMTQNQANFTALAGEQSGAPAIRGLNPIVESSASGVASDTVAIILNSDFAYRVFYYYRPVNDGVTLNMRVTVSSVVQSGSVYHTQGAASATSISLTNASAVGNATTEGVHGEILIYQPSSSSLYTYFETRSVWGSTTGRGTGLAVGASYSVASAINGINFFFSSGNISTGNSFIVPVRSSQNP